MSYLPYGEASFAGWTGAFGLSVSLHGAAIFGVLGSVGGWFAPPPETPESAPFMISFAPIGAEAVEPVMVPPDPVEETPAGITPEALNPSSIEAETVQPVVTETLEPEVLTPLAEAVEPAPILPDSGSGVGAAAPEATPASAPESSATEQDIALAAWIEKIRATEAPPCLVALLRREGETSVGLALVGSDQAAMSTYSDRLIAGEELPPVLSRVQIDPRQCPALDFLRSLPDYPATQLGLGVDAAVVTSGGRLGGVIRGTAGRQLTLLLVDDNGVVQDLGRFLSFSGNLARFEVPVTRSGTSRPTGQIVIALATRRSPAELLSRAGRLASEVFAGLSKDLTDNALVAVATVEIR
jgi:hypothetical protein